MLKISVKDFGPIVEGTVNLKPLTIFVGPSNAGKSYLAMLIYSLMRSFESLTYPYGGIISYEPIRSRRRSRPRPFLSLGNEIEISDKGAKAIDDWVRSIRPTSRRMAEILFGELPDEIRRHANASIKSSFDSLKPLFNRELLRCHGDISAIRSRRKAATHLQIGLEQDHPLLELNFKEDQNSSVSLSSKNWDISQSKVDLSQGLLDIIQTEATSRSSRSKEAIRRYYVDLLAQIIEAASEVLFEKFPSSSYYLPAARSGIAQGHKAIASILVRQSSFAGIRPLEIPTLSGIITDFMGHILTMERVGGKRSITDLKEVVDFLENKVVRGKIDIDRGKEITYPEISYIPSTGQPDMGHFPFHKTSSMVSELAPLVLFLKYLVRQGDLVILEEPESHLHPASQRQMARGIVRLVNSGVKVIITTHSDYFIGQINNLLKLSLVSKQRRAKKHYDASDCLKPDDVSAYHFELDRDLVGSFVKELPIVPDFGIDEQEFARASEALYEETISLQRGRAR